MYQEQSTPCWTFWLALPTLCFCSYITYRIYSMVSNDDINYVDITLYSISALIPVFFTLTFRKHFINADDSSLTFGYSHFNVKLSYTEIIEIKPIEIEWIKWGGCGWKIQSMNQRGYILGNGAGIAITTRKGIYYVTNCKNPNMVIDEYKRSSSLLP